jgi:hypothetical protein
MNETVHTSDSKVDNDGGANNRSAKLQGILNKIKKKNTEKDEGTGGVKLASGGKNSDSSVERYTALKLDDDVVGLNIIEKRFQKGHLRNMLNGAVDTKY